MCVARQLPRVKYRATHCLARGACRAVNQPLCDRCILLTTPTDAGRSRNDAQVSIDVESKAAHRSFLRRHSGTVLTAQHF